VHLVHVGEPALQSGALVCLVEDLKRSLELGFRGVLKAIDVITDDLPVHNQVALLVHHV